MIIIFNYQKLFNRVIKKRNKIISSFLMLCFLPTIFTFNVKTTNAQTVYNREIFVKNFLPVSRDKSDLDKDGLSDIEEDKWGTDPLNPDTDGDSYLDGVEVKNGYNPLGLGRIISRDVKQKSVFFSAAVEPDLTIVENNSWNREMAEHLARRVLFDPTHDDIDNVLRVGSRVAAVNYLFTPATSVQENEFINKLNAFAVNNNENLSDRNYMEELYLFTLMHDPNRAKRKLWMVWEDTFSVDAPIGGSRDITYTDVKNMHDFLYENTLGNYQMMAKSMQTTYAMGKYLDLFNANTRYPNENFSRELLQLFLMEENLPLNKDVVNYTSRDIAALAKILTGYVVDEGSRDITYDPNEHNTENVVFLGEEYNNTTDVVDYIFSKKSNEIAEFIGAKLLRYYVNDNYSQNDLNFVADLFLQNNFEIEPTVKGLLSSNIMYSSEAMNNLRYKNPMELIVGSYKYFYQDGVINNYEPTKSWLRDLKFTPYRPTTIFGRDGFEDNETWFNAYTVNSWVSVASNLAFDDDGNPVNWTVENIIPWVNNSVEAAGKTPNNLIDDLETGLLLGRDLNNETRIEIINYLTTTPDGGQLIFNPTNLDYQNTKIRGAIALILTQDEYLLQSGHDNNLTNVDAAGVVSDYENDPSLILIKLGGGYDYMSVVIPFTDPEYNEYRQSLAIPAGSRSNLSNEYALNNIANEFLPLYNSGELSFINSVGLNGQSRSHSRSLEQIETGLLENGVIGEVFSDQPNSSIDLVSLYNGKPIIFKGAPSLEVGTGEIEFLNREFSNEDEEDYIFKTVKDIIVTRSHPNDLGQKYFNATRLNEVSIKNKDDGGRGNAGYSNEQQFDFLDTLLDENLGKVFYMRGNGGYDTHGNQEETFNSRFGKLTTDVTTFYNSVKNDHDLTIVIYSEFGRTNKMNGNNGTDHGVGGGMVVLSNVVDWPGLVGTLKPSEDSRNWLTPRVDVRSVWGSLLQEHYRANPEQIFGQELDISNYFDQINPVIVRLNNSLINPTTANFSFSVEDSDFKIDNNNLSRAEFRYGLIENNLNRTSEVVVNGIDQYSISLSGLAQGSEYFYRLTVSDDQINKTVASGSFKTSIEKDLVNGAYLNPVEETSLRIPSIARDLNSNQEIIFNNINLTASSTSTINGSGGIRVTFPGETRLLSVRNHGPGPGNFNGIIKAPEEIEVNSFFRQNENITVDGVVYNRSRLNKLIKIGADNGNIGLNFNKNVVVRIPVENVVGSVRVIYSHNGDDWHPLNSSIVRSGNSIEFNTNHFTYFLLIDDDASNNNDSVDSNDGNDDNDNNQRPRNSGNGNSGLNPAWLVAPDGPFGVDVTWDGVEKNQINFKFDLNNTVKKIAISEDGLFKQASLHPVDYVENWKVKDGNNQGRVYIKFYSQYGFSTKKFEIHAGSKNNVNNSKAVVEIENILPEMILTKNTK